jgi:hypothetical protein
MTMSRLYLLPKRPKKPNTPHQQFNIHKPWYRWTCDVTRTFSFQFPSAQLVSNEISAVTRRAVHSFGAVTHVLLISNINYPHHSFVMTLCWLQAFLLIKALLLKHFN